VKVLDFGGDYLDIEHIDSVHATAKAAHTFGKNLARLHLSGAPHYGYTPAKYAYFGPLSDPVPGVNSKFDSFKDYFIYGRLLPMLEIGAKRGEFTSGDVLDTKNVLEQYFEQEEESDWANLLPAKVHGDLWSGNLLWAKCQSEGEASPSTPLDTEAVLIDPSAHGGHPEEDLAMLALFGQSHLGEILRGYQEVSPLLPGFEKRFTLHNLYPIAGHVVFFGGGYYSQYKSMLDALGAN
jgi:fructosamine-3-kinase